MTTMLPHVVLLFVASFVLACAKPAIRTIDEIPDYDRAEWGGWRDDDRDCQTTRFEVLLAEATGPVEFRSDQECVIESGEWVDPYSGEVYTDPRILDVDHLVPLRNAHDSGGWKWSRERKRAYANDLSDPDHLVAVHRSLNRSKGSKGPDEWPDDDAPEAFPHCWYAETWIGIKDRWELEIPPSEETALEEMLETCP